MGPFFVEIYIASVFIVVKCVIHVQRQANNISEKKYLIISSFPINIAL
jgi:hypothetical protein